MSLVSVQGLAAVDRIEIHDRSLVANGTAYGRVGSYVRISGRLHYSVDPDSTYNSAIVDLGLASRNGRGQVTFSGDFILLTPLDPSRRNNRLFYDVANRGRMQLLGRFNDASGRDGARTAVDVGNGFLLEQGYSLLWTGWNWDVAPRPNLLNINLPVARQENGQPVTGSVISEMTPLTRTFSSGHIAAGSIGYKPILANTSNAQLSVRAPGEAQYTAVARQQWRFGRPIEATPDSFALNDDTWITLDSGFEPGRVYRLVYQARNPPIVGLGLASIRDALSFFRFAQMDSTGNPNPLTENGADLPEAVLVYGASQSGRVLNTLIWHGLHVDETGRMTFDGAIIDTAGAGKGGFNFRFAQTSRHFGHDIGLDYPTDYFPFSSGMQTDRETQTSDSLFDQARALGAVPRVFILNTSTEYWTRSASLVHIRHGWVS